MTPQAEPTADDPFLVELDPNALRARTLQGSLITTVVQAAKMIAQFGSTMILGRLLFPADFGLMAMVYPIVAFIQLFGNLGFGQAVIQRQTIARGDVASLFWLNLAIAVALMLVAAALSPVIGWLYGDQRVIALMMAVATLLPISALSSIHVAILSRQMRFGTIARNDLIATLAGVAATIGAAAQGMGYWSLLIGQLINTLTTCTLTWGSVRWIPSRPALTAQLRRDIGFGANITGANIATFITSSGDSVIIGAANGETALGIYDRSYRLVVQPLGQLLVPISAVALPHLSRLQDQPDEYRRTYLDFLRIICLFSMPLMLVCTTNAEEIVRLLLGERWRAAAVTFAWISVGGFLSGVYASLPWLFISQARTSAMRRYMSVSAVFNLLSFAVGTIWGVEGVAACAAIVFLGVSVPVVSYGATRSGAVSLGDIAACCVPYVAVAIAGGLVLHGLRGIIPDPLLRLGAAIALATLGYGILAVVLPRERMLVLAGFERLCRLLTARTA